MVKDRFLWAMVVLSMAAIILMPIYSMTVTIPKLVELLAIDSENDAVRIARPLANKFFPESGEGSKVALPVNFMDHARSMQHDFKLWKLKVFSSTGETLFSSDSSDIGKLNTHDYFHKIVAAGNNYTKVVHKNTESLENEVVRLDVVETYVPIMRSGKFVGAFEIYLDITDSTARIDHVITKSNWIVFIISLLMFIALILTTIQAGRSLEERNRVEKENEKLILDLRSALAEIRTLQGILPICCCCKKVRDDQGSWTQIEAYIRDHSEADFSHGYCPECAQKTKAEFKEYLANREAGGRGTPPATDS